MPWIYDIKLENLMGDCVLDKRVIIVGALRMVS